MFKEKGRERQTVSKSICFCVNTVCEWGHAPLMVIKASDSNLNLGLDLDWQIWTQRWRKRRRKKEKRSRQTAESTNRVRCLNLSTDVMVKKKGFSGRKQDQTTCCGVRLHSHNGLHSLSAPTHKLLPQRVQRERVVRRVCTYRYGGGHSVILDDNGVQQIKRIA